MVLISCHLLFFKLSVIVSPGICHLCSQPGYQSSHRGLSVYYLRWHVGGDLSHSHRPAGHLLHTSGCTRVSARENEARLVGSSHLLGAGGPLCRKNCQFYKDNSTKVLMHLEISRSKYSKSVRTLLPELRFISSLHNASPVCFFVVYQAKGVCKILRLIIILIIFDGFLFKFDAYFLIC